MRPIDADALIKNIKNTADLGGWIGAAVYHIKQVAIKYIEDAPTIDIEPKQGENLRKEYPSLFECSVCGATCDDAYTFNCDINYCPNCGAKMSNASNAFNTLETLVRGETE